MSDTTESSRQATHARQEGVEDNVAALAGPVVGASGPAATDTPPSTTSVSESVASVAKKASGEISARWVAAGMGIGSAALVAALLYANRNNERKRDKR